MRIVLATHNRDKVREIQDILAGLDAEILTVDDFTDVPEPVEDGRTLEENALKKARAIRAATGVSALADDTGLEVDALDGAPGVFAARYAGEGASYRDNSQKLLREMHGVPEARRGATFRCVLALALAGEDTVRVQAFLQGSPAAAAAADLAAGEPVDTLLTEGALPGRITTAPRGKGGFGYDPVFIEPRTGRTLAEMGTEEKNRISHRYRALVEMRELLLRVGLVGEAP